MRISIFGMGFVGAVSAACVCEKGHTVICVDTEDKQMIPFLAIVHRFWLALGLGKLVDVTA